MVTRQDLWRRIIDIQILISADGHNQSELYYLIESIAHDTLWGKNGLPFPGVHPSLSQPVTCPSYPNSSQANGSQPGGLVANTSQTADAPPPPPPPPAVAEDSKDQAQPRASLDPAKSLTPSSSRQTQPQSTPTTNTVKPYNLAWNLKPGMGSGQDTHMPPSQSQTQSHLDDRGQPAQAAADTQGHDASRRSNSLQAHASHHKRSSQDSQDQHDSHDQNRSHSRYGFRPRPPVEAKRKWNDFREEPDESLESKRRLA
ncbi:hypothetical protein PVAG01_03821 [Phlyctema vagabunda]|uniref:Uncharacterized protein n=1 Tax=Phlyctema vagabunda TaxID=108571 RepID=A0ABR4PMH8_9HELO